MLFRSGGGALDCDDKQTIAPKCVLGIDGGRGEEDPVLDCDRGEFAGAWSEDCESWDSRRVRGGGGLVVSVVCVWELGDWREEVFLPGVGTDVEAEEFVGVRGRFLLELVEPWGLVIRPALGEFIDRGDFVVGDRVLFEGGSGDAEAVGDEGIEEGLQEVGW